MCLGLVACSSDEDASVAQNAPSAPASRETPLAEPASVDDQAAWVDSETVAYTRSGEAPASADIWTVPADGSGRPRLLLHGASSPASLR